MIAVSEVLVLELLIDQGWNNLQRILICCLICCGKGMVKASPKPLVRLQCFQSVHHMKTFEVYKNLDEKIFGSQFDQ